MENIPSNIQAALDFASKNTEAKIIQLNDPRSDATLHIAEVAKDHSLASLKKYFDEYLEKPERARGTSEHLNVDSFIDHVLRHKHETSVVDAYGDLKNRIAEKTGLPIFTGNPEKV